MMIAVRRREVVEVEEHLIVEVDLEVDVADELHFLEENAIPRGNFCRVIIRQLM